MKKIVILLMASAMGSIPCLAQNSAGGNKSMLKLFRFGNQNSEKPGVLMPDGKMLDVSTFGEDYNEFFFATNGISRLEKWLVSNAKKCPDAPKGRMAAPVSHPSKIVAIGLNYAKHAQEGGTPVPKEPVIFMKATTSLCGPFDNLIIPKNSVKTDWEVELAIVIGRKASYVPEDSAMNYIAGFTVINDYSERSFQLEGTGQWTKGKSADTFAPLGPYLISPGAIGDPQNLKLWLNVNGEMMQNSNTNDMVFRIPFLVSYVSQFMTLLPGDVIATGTPEGVGLGHKPPIFLKPGDVVELGIENIGTQKQTAVAFGH
jgi:2-keto-4-pentenoate hydratase/2-oxohepta-3-ene-1,7-dioic acid hydratase in catechol pathway